MPPALVPCPEREARKKKEKSEAAGLRHSPSHCARSLRPTEKRAPRPHTRTAMDDLPASQYEEERAARIAANMSRLGEWRWREAEKAEEGAFFLAVASGAALSSSLTRRALPLSSPSPESLGVLSQASSLATALERPKKVGKRKGEREEEGQRELFGIPLNLTAPALSPSLSILPAPRSPRPAPRLRPVLPGLRPPGRPVP